MQHLTLVTSRQHIFENHQHYEGTKVSRDPQSADTEG